MALGSPPRLEHHRVDGSLGVPGLAPLAHSLDLLGLITPDGLTEGSHARHPDIEDELANPQSTGVVLHHPVDPAQVVGAAGRAHIVVVGAVIHRFSDRSRPSRWRRGHHPVVLMGIHLRLGHRGHQPQQCRCRKERETHREHRRTLWIGCTLL